MLKLLKIIPHSLLKKFAYSKIGSKVVAIIKKRESKTWYEIENGIKIYLDLTNPDVWDLIQGKDDEREIKEIFLSNINNGDIVIDVGANFGEYSLIASKKTKIGRVIAIEPLRENVERLKKNFLLNKLSNYEVIESAVGNESKKMPLYKKNDNVGYGFLDPTINEKQLIQTTEITVETIDDIISSRKIKKVNMLKIDVEGFEYEVLLGCKNSFKENKIEKIICEIHLQYLEKKGLSKYSIFKLLEENGFLINEINKKDTRTHILAYQSKK